MFMIWDSRLEGLQLFWLNFQHWLLPYLPVNDFQRHSTTIHPHGRRASGLVLRKSRQFWAICDRAILRHPLAESLTAVKFYKEINMNSVKVCSVSQAFSNAYGESKPQGNFRTVATADVITVKRIWRVSYSLEMELTLCPYHTRCNSVLKSFPSISVLPICSINIIVTSHKKSYSKPGNTLKLMTVIKQAMKWNETSGVLSKIKQQNGYISKISHAHHWPPASSGLSGVSWPASAKCKHQYGPLEDTPRPHCRPSYTLYTHTNMSLAYLSRRSLYHLTAAVDLVSTLQPRSRNPS